MAERRRSATRADPEPERDWEPERDREPEREREPEPERDREPEPDGAAPDQRRMSAAEAGREGLEQVLELTGKDAESITGVKRSKDGWLVTVEVVEDHRIPSSTDILATYEAELDGDGELLSYHRTRRYSRGAGDDGDR